MTITVKDPDTARSVLQAVEDQALMWLIEAATSTDPDQQSYAEWKAAGLSDVARQIVDELIPEDPRTVILREEIELGMV